jgi:hypothetical protein
MSQGGKGAGNDLPGMDFTKKVFQIGVILIFAIFSFFNFGSCLMIFWALKLR